MHNNHPVTPLRKILRITHIKYSVSKSVQEHYEHKISGSDRLWLKRNHKVKRLKSINMQNVKLLAVQQTVIPEFAFS